MLQAIVSVIFEFLLANLFARVVGANRIQKLFSWLRSLLMWALVIGFFVFLGTAAYVIIRDAIQWFIR